MELICCAIAHIFPWLLCIIRVANQKSYQTACFWWPYLFYQIIWSADEEVQLIEMFKIQN